MVADHLGSNPIFIGGFRSGTTLLVNLLGLHPVLMPWFETKAFCEPLRWLRVLQCPDLMTQEGGLVRPADIQGFDVDAVSRRMIRDFRETAERIDGRAASGKAPGERYPIGHDVALYSLGEAETAVKRWVSSIGESKNIQRIARATGELMAELGNLQLSLGGKCHWVNKTPEIVRFIPEIQACLGPSKMIMMVRDGRHVVRSAEKLGWARASEIATWWQALIIEARQGAEENPERYLEVKYEALVTQPEAELDRVLAFLDVDLCGSALVEKYLSALGISQLIQAASGVAYPAAVSSASDEIESLIDMEFNRSLGY